MSRTGVTLTDLDPAFVTSPLGSSCCLDILAIGSIILTISLDLSEQHPGADDTCVALPQALRPDEAYVRSGLGLRITQHVGLDIDDVTLAVDPAALAAASQLVLHAMLTLRTSDEPPLTSQDSLLIKHHQATDDPLTKRNLPANCEVKAGSQGETSTVVRLRVRNMKLIIPSPLTEALNTISSNARSDASGSDISNSTATAAGKVNANPSHEAALSEEERPVSKTSSFWSNAEVLLRCSLISVETTLKGVGGSVFVAEGFELALPTDFTLAPPNSMTPSFEEASSASGVGLEHGFLFNGSVQQRVTLDSVQLSVLPQPLLPPSPPSASSSLDAATAPVVWHVHASLGHVGLVADAACVARVGKRLGLRWAECRVPIVRIDRGG